MFPEKMFFGERMRKFACTVLMCLAFFPVFPFDGVALADGERLIMRPPDDQVRGTRVRFPARKRNRIREEDPAKLVRVEPECIMDASKRFGVHVAVILTILDVEGGEIGGSADNRNGSWDMGPMQVNTCHMDRIGALGITRREIQNNGCLNVQVGTWLLRGHLNETSGDVLESVGRYHSRNEPYKARYQAKARAVYAAIRKDPAKHVGRILKKANGDI